MARLVGATAAPPVHNKYAGIQEFRNLIALFVNLIGPTGDAYDNAFRNDGKQIQWFASPRCENPNPIHARAALPPNTAS